MTAVKHAGRKMSHHRFSLNMKIAKHLVRLPTAQEADAVRINIGAKERHGTGRAQRAGGNVLGKKAVLWAEKGDR